MWDDPTRRKPKDMEIRIPKKYCDGCHMNCKYCINVEQHFTVSGWDYAI